MITHTYIAFGYFKKSFCTCYIFYGNIHFQFAHLPHWPFAEWAREHPNRFPYGWGHLICTQKKHTFHLWNMCNLQKKRNKKVAFKKTFEFECDITKKRNAKRILKRMQKTRLVFKWQTNAFTQVRPLPASLDWQCRDTASLVTPWTPQAEWNRVENVTNGIGKITKNNREILIKNWNIVIKNFTLAEQIKLDKFTSHRRQIISSQKSLAVMPRNREAKWLLR